MNDWDSVQHFVKSQIDYGNYSSEDLQTHPEVVPYCESTMSDSAKRTFFKMLMGVQYGIAIFSRHRPLQTVKIVSGRSVGGIVYPITVLR